MPVITLLTDYGLKDSYVAEMKGVILGIAPDANIVDISHDVGNYNIDEGAFHIARSVPYFQKGTVHVGVVDPGVGSERKGIIIQAKGAWLVGPDNGLLAPAAERLGIERIFDISRRDLLPQKISDVFDGRDTFGPTAALLLNRVPPENIGVKIPDYKKLQSYKPVVNGKNIEATIIHVDGFGNLVTNVTYELLKSLMVEDDFTVAVTVGDSEYILPYVKIFSAVPAGDLLLLVAGGGYLEFAVNQGNAAKQMGIGKGEHVHFSIIK